MNATRAVGVRRVVLVCALLATAGASAEILTITHTVDLPSTFLPDSRLVEFPGFNAALGELVGVEVGLVADFTGTAGFENLDPDLSAFYTLTGQWTVWMLLPVEDPRYPDDLMLELNATRVRQGLVDPFDGVVDFGGFSGATFNLTRPAAAAGMLYEDAATLALFDVPDVLACSLGAFFDGTLETSPTVSTATSFSGGQFDAEFAITYHYTPEPSTALLTFVAGLLVFRRQRTATPCVRPDNRSTMAR